MEGNGKLADIKNGATPFNIYYEKLNGADILINFENRYLSILDSKKKVLSNVYFSKKITDAFTVQNLLRKDEPQKDIAYFVFEKGHDNKDWLWAIPDLLNIETLFI